MDADRAKLEKERAAIEGDIAQVKQTRKGFVDLYGDGNPKFELKEDKPERLVTSAPAPAKPKRKYKKRAKKAAADKTNGSNGTDAGEKDVELLAAARTLAEPFSGPALALAVGKADDAGKKKAANRCSKWRRYGWLASGPDGYVRTKDFPKAA